MDATINFERYVGMGMDHVNEAHCIGGSCQDNPLVFWMKLGAMSASWHQIKGKSEWEYSDSPLFKGMQGSLYVLPLGESRADGARGTYVRYVMGASVHTFLPDFMIETFASHEMRSNITSFVRKLADAAR